MAASELKRDFSSNIIDVFAKDTIGLIIDFVSVLCRLVNFMMTRHEGNAIRLPSIIQRLLHGLSGDALFPCSRLKSICKTSREVPGPEFGLRMEHGNFAQNVAVRVSTGQVIQETPS